MEVSKERNDEKDEEVWYVTQHNYICDLLDQNEEKVKEEKIPITRDQSQMEKDDKPAGVPSIRSSQKLVGEALWLVTRSRPDLMFAVARMGANVLEATQAVLDTGAQMKGYLLGTKEEGLCYRREEEEVPSIQVFTDASFAPGSEESRGCYVVCLGTCPVFWRSGRQSTITLSTAESELNEIVEGMTARESIGVVIEEIIGQLPHIVWTDI